MIRFTKRIEEATAITHGGKFHADDIFSIILLEMVFGNVIVFRSLNTNPAFFNQTFPLDPIIFDVGRGKYDHHQAGGNGYHPIPDNSHSTIHTLKPIPYASFGLLWRDFGKKVCDSLVPPELSQKLWQEIENSLVLGIDASDNGIYPKPLEEYIKYRMITIPNAIAIINPITELEEKNIEKFLEQAIEFAKVIFDVVIQNSISKVTNPESFTCDPSFGAEELFSEMLLRRFFPDDYEKKLHDPKHFTNLDILAHPKERVSKDDTRLPIPFSSLGKIWSLYGKSFCNPLFLDAEYPDYVWNSVRVKLIVCLDALCNGIRPTMPDGYINFDMLFITDFFESIDCSNLSMGNFEEIKEKLLKMADLILSRLLSKAVDSLRNRKYVEEKIDETVKLKHRNKYMRTYPSDILVLDKHVQYSEWLANSKQSKARNISMVVFPSSRGGFIAKPISQRNGLVKRSFPKSWFGLSDQELRNVSKIPTATFVHNSGLLGEAEDLKGAIALAEKAVKSYS